MHRFPKFIATGTLIMLSAGPGLAQQSKGQRDQTKQVQVQTIAPRSVSYGGINRNPWYGDKSVQDHLKISGAQYNGLNKGYGEAWATYNESVGQLPNTLTEQERAQKMQEFQGVFYQDLNKSVDVVITDPQQRQRYNQLYLQYQGYGAFDDPIILQKLNLTAEQRQKFAQYGKEWHKQMGVHHQSYLSDPQAATNGYNELNKQTNERFNSVLNEQQQQIWHQLTGASYNFPPGVYFPANEDINGRPRNNFKQR
jgi:hypothetical protein